MSTLPEPKDSQEWQGLPPKRQSYPELFMQRMRQTIWHENKCGNISPLTYSCALRAGASYNYLLVDGKRRLTSREMLRLQGCPETFKIVVTYQAMRKLTGNSVAVLVIEAVARNMIDIIQQRQQVDKKRIKSINTA